MKSSVLKMESCSYYGKELECVFVTSTNVREFARLFIGRYGVGRTITLPSKTIDRGRKAQVVKLYLTTDKSEYIERIIYLDCWYVKYDDAWWDGVYFPEAGFPF